MTWSKNPFVAFVILMMATIAIMGIRWTPAQAETQVSKCVAFNDGTGSSLAHICAVVNFQRDADGTGGTITLVRIYADGDLNAYFESKIEDCDNLRIWNDKDVVKWRKDNAECDLYKSAPRKTWYPDVDMHATTTFNLGWTFYPKINGGPDPGYTHISIQATL